MSRPFHFISFHLKKRWSWHFKSSSSSSSSSSSTASHPTAGHVTYFTCYLFAIWRHFLFPHIFLLFYLILFIIQLAFFFQIGATLASQIMQISRQVVQNVRLFTLDPTNPSALNFVDKLTHFSRPQPNEKKADAAAPWLATFSLFPFLIFFFRFN